MDLAFKATRHNGRKKSSRRSFLRVFGGPPGSRTRHQRIMLTSYGFRHPFRVCGLDCLLSLRPARTVSTRSLGESFARDCHAARAAEVSPNLSSSTKGQSQLTPRQPIRAVRTLASCRTALAKSAALTKHELEARKTSYFTALRPCLRRDFL